MEFWISVHPLSRIKETDHPKTRQTCHDKTRKLIKAQTVEPNHPPSFLKGVRREIRSAIHSKYVLRKLRKLANSKDSRCPKCYVTLSSQANGRGNLLSATLNPVWQMPVLLLSTTAGPSSFSQDCSDWPREPYFQTVCTAGEFLYGLLHCNVSGAFTPRFLPGWKVH